MATDYEKLVHDLITANQKACEAVSQVSDGGTANRYESMNDALEGKTNGAFIEEVELMQFTGLKDARGKEFYAGDIMQDSDDCYNIVEWSNECGAWLVRAVMADGSPGYTEHLADYNEVWKVIGNIYENPEMLQTI